MESCREALRDELREIGALAQDGIHSPRTRAFRAIMIASAAGQVSPDEARYWATQWHAACGARVTAKSMPGAVSKVRVWIVAGRSEAGLATLATLDMIASARPALSQRYAEKATTALRAAARLGRELTREECMAVLESGPRNQSNAFGRCRNTPAATLRAPPMPFWVAGSLLTD